MNSTSEFWKAIEDWVPPERVEIEYRLYHTGVTIDSALSNPADGPWPPGDYITVTRQEYDEVNYTRNRVVDGKMVRVVPPDVNVLRLEKSHDGEFTSLPNNIIFACDTGDNYKRKIYKLVLE